MKTTIEVKRKTQLLKSERALINLLEQCQWIPKEVFTENGLSEFQKAISEANAATGREQSENPVKEQPKQKVKTFLLFQTDTWQTKSSRVFFGAFNTFGKANQAAKDNNLYHPEAQVVIEEVTLNEFNEI